MYESIITTYRYYWVNHSLSSAVVARQNVVAARSLAVQQVAIAAHLSDAPLKYRALERCTRHVTLDMLLPLQFTLCSSALYDPYPARYLPFSHQFFVSYLICIYLISIFRRLRVFDYYK